MFSTKHLIFSAALLAASQTQATTMLSQPDAHKAVLNIFTYDREGKLLHSGNAFAIDAKGTAICSYDLMKGAHRADVIDANGKKYKVHRIMGANSTTDLVKFSIEGYKSKYYFTVTQKPAETNTPLYLVTYSTEKKATPLKTTVTQTEAYNAYRYYQMDATNDHNLTACPLTDASGTLVAIVQRSANAKATNACAIDARFVNELNISATSAFNSDLANIAIPKALPQNAKDALTYLYTLPASDSLTCQLAYNDFVSEYPHMADGYMARAAFLASHHNYAWADNDMTQALKCAEADTTGMQPDAVHYNISNLIYKVSLTHADSIPYFKDWGYAKAENEANMAYQLKKHTLYMMLKGNCQYQQKKYNEAYESYLKVCSDKHFASPDTYLSAARALQLSQGDQHQVIALLDSCIALLPQPVNHTHAAYYWERAQQLVNMGEYRKAVFDYNEFEKAVGPSNLTETFYYQRFQIEVKARMYQQALDDIRTSAAYADDPHPFRIEEALLLLQVGENQQAVKLVEQMVKTHPNQADCYKILGIAYGELGNKPLAVKNLNKAKSLGDKQAESLIQKYK